MDNNKIEMRLIKVNKTYAFYISDCKKLALVNLKTNKLINLKESKLCINYFNKIEENKNGLLGKVKKNNVIDITKHIEEITNSTSKKATRDSYNFITKKVIQLEKKGWI